MTSFKFQPVKKKVKLNGPTLNSLDDYCLSKIISFALRHSSAPNKHAHAEDNSRTEKNLSLVSRRWYLLTQTQVSEYGVRRIKLDEILDKTTMKEQQSNLRLGAKTCQIARFAGPTNIARPGVLTAKNNACTGIPASKLMMKAGQQPTAGSNRGTDLTLFRTVQPKLLKYKHILIDGAISCQLFKLLLTALDASQIKQLYLNIKLENDRTSLDDFLQSPKQFNHIEYLSLGWISGSNNVYSNSLVWTVFTRAKTLKTLELHLSCEQQEDSMDSKTLDRCLERFDRLAGDRSRPSGQHHDLDKVIFIHSPPAAINPITSHSVQCGTEGGGSIIYTSLMKRLLRDAPSVREVHTNDDDLVEDLIKASDRVCTTHVLSCLRVSKPIKSMDLLSRLLKSNVLGTDYLSFVVDTSDQLEDIRQHLESFKPSRHQASKCQITLHLKDQKFADSEDKIKNLVHLSRMAEITVHVSAQQRVSIDCCHLMWSVGRALQTTTADVLGWCLFRIVLQPNGLIQSSKTMQNNFTEITVPFGSCLHYKINSIREDPIRHREIMKALRKDCYHQFVKSVRDNVTP